MQKARFEHSPLGNLLGKKLKVSGDDSDDGDDGYDSDDGDNILNQMRNHLNNSPKPVLQLPKQQSDLQTQTIPIPATRYVKQSDLQTQTIRKHQSDLQTQTSLPSPIESPIELLTPPRKRSPMQPPIESIQPMQPPIKLLTPLRKRSPIESIQPPIESIQPPIESIQLQQNKSTTKKKYLKDFKLYYETEPYGTTT